ncbi:hypothetical protein MPH_11767 [Macrophomina phaseolina MS6]|uniref:Uncharacterized protein n=1 Tax=Macrophomina phaseolina (strain MS6) TaxID=1126212 RepID=K2RLW2_MACPH|nr:hypothetical protein MPH_11767 [Macrophomina phaseolina MS6]
MEIIAIALSKEPWLHHYELLFVDETPLRTFTTIMNAVLVQWRVAYADRLGVGQMDATAWLESRPLPKLIRLVRSLKIYCDVCCISIYNPDFSRGLFRLADGGRKAYALKRGDHYDSGASPEASVPISHSLIVPKP